MLCPEVWNFKAPESSFSFQKLNPHESDHLSTIHNFIYNHLVSIVLPDTFKVPESLTEALDNDCDYYKLTNVKLSEFVARDFIANFVNSGSLYALSVDSRIDCDNCASITPEGQLILSLTKSTYQSLGLEGVVSHFHARNSDRYIVTIDLKLKHFKPGKPNYERTRKCLEQVQLNVILTWEPPNKSICPSSIAKYFHDLGCETKLCEIKRTSHTLYSSKVPIIEEDNYNDIVEWLGMVSVNGDFNGGSESYLSTYETPEPNRSVGQVRFIQWRGLFTANQILTLYNQLRQLSNSDWLALYVQGFSDAPTAWKGEEHHYYTHGDDGYVYILNKNESVTICKQKCSQKRYSKKT